MGCGMSKKKKVVHESMICKMPTINELFEGIDTNLNRLKELEECLSSSISQFKLATRKIDTELTENIRSMLLNFLLQKEEKFKIQITENTPYLVFEREFLSEENQEIADTWEKMIEAYGYSQTLMPELNEFMGNRISKSNNYYEIVKMCIEKHQASPNDAFDALKMTQYNLKLIKDATKALRNVNTLVDELTEAINSINDIYFEDQEIQKLLVVFQGSRKTGANDDN